jgi:hypothetical protein
MEETRYRIVVRGKLTPAFGTGLGGDRRGQTHGSDPAPMGLTPLPGATALEGDFSDQAELQGMLERLRNLGIEVVSVDAVG